MFYLYIETLVLLLSSEEKDRWTQKNPRVELVKPIRRGNLCVRLVFYIIKPPIIVRVNCLSGCFCGKVIDAIMTVTVDVTAGQTLERSF
jgi:hypothetical protein